MFWISFSSYAFTGLLLMAVSWPMIRRRIAPNPFYGFRTPKTLSHKDVWYPANEYSGRQLFTAGALITLASLLLAPLNLIRGGGFTAYSIAMVFVMVGSLLWSIVRSFQFLNRL